MPSESASVKVVVRSRPMTPEEENKSAKNIVKIAGDKVTVDAAGKVSTFSFDGAYSHEVSNRQMFSDKFESFVQRSLAGYNVSMMVLGAMGTGQTRLVAGSGQDPGILTLIADSMFKHMSDGSGKKIYLVTASYLEVVNEKFVDLLNPHDAEMEVRQHVQKGIYVENLTEISVDSSDELQRLYDQGTRAKMAAPPGTVSCNSVFYINIRQKEKQSSKVGVKSTLSLFDFSAGGGKGSDSGSGTSALLNLFSALGDSKKKGGYIPYRDSRMTQLLQDVLGGNCLSLMIGLFGPADTTYHETLTTLQNCQYIKSVKNKASTNIDDTYGMISELRVEISKMKDKIAATSEPNKEEVDKLEGLVKDLQMAKSETWEEKERQSNKFETERKTNLGNKGVLEWIMDSTKKGNKDIQEKMVQLQREKDQLAEQQKEKRKVIDDLKDDLQIKINEYSKSTEQGKMSNSESKSRVNAIQTLKDRIKQETETFRSLKQQTKDVEDRQMAEREGGQIQATALKGNLAVRSKIAKEELSRLEAGHRSSIQEEVERSKGDIQQELADIQRRASNEKQYDLKEGTQMAKDLIQNKQDLILMTNKLKAMETEKQFVINELSEVHRVHKEQLELQQLQHFQTFRKYREMYEEQKAVIEQRYRMVLEDSISDSVFLSSSNGELTRENVELRQYIAEMKDTITKCGGRIPHSEIGL